MKRIVFIFILLLAFLASGLMYLLNSTWLINHHFPSYARKYFKSVTLKTFTAERQTFIFPNRITLHNVVCEFEKNHSSYKLQSVKVELLEVLSMFRPESQIKLGTENLRIDSDFIKADAVNMKLYLVANQHSIGNFVALFQAGNFHFFRYRFENFTAKIKGDAQNVEITELSSGAYGGKLNGQIAVVKDFSWIYTVWLEFSGWNTEDLKTLAEPLFSQLTGRLSGTLRVIGDPEKFTIFDLNVNMSESTFVTADFFNRIFQRLGSKKTGEQLQVLSTAKHNIPLSQAGFRLKNTEPKQGALTLNFKTRDSDLAVNGSLPISFPEGLKKYFLTYDNKNLTISH